MGYYSEQHAEMQTDHGMSDCEFHHAMQEQALDAAIKDVAAAIKDDPRILIKLEKELGHDS